MTTGARTRRSNAGPGSASHRAIWFTAVAVAAITVVAFLPALSGGFVSWDDDKNFITNPNYRGLSSDHLQWMWTTFHLGTWIPLSWMTLGLDYLLWGMQPRGYHLTNVLLHSANAMVAFFLFRRLLRNTDASHVAHIAGPAFAALVFAVHPLRVESVAWITERRDVLSGLFYFSSLLAYLRAIQDERRRSYWVSVGLCVLALLAKGTAVTLPVVLVIANVWPLRRIGGDIGWTGPGARRVYRELLPFVALAGVVTVVVFTALQPVAQLPVAAKFAVSVYSLQVYFAKTLIPLGLSPLYAMPEVVNPAQATFMLSGLFFALGAAMAWAVRRRAPGVSVALLTFVAVLFPLLGVHQGGPQIMADRNTYNASIALACLAGGLLMVLWTRAPRVAPLLATAVVATLAMLTWNQARVWRDSESLWARVLAVEPDSPHGHNNFANVLMRQGRVDEAMRHYERAIRARPRYAEAHTNLGVALAAQGRFDEAIAKYRRALELQPRNDEAESNWGVALARSGDPASAIEHFVAATTANPANADAHVNWGNALVRLGQPDTAITHYRDAVAWRPDHADAHHNWGVALAQQGKLQEAVERFEAALTSAPGHPQAREYLARARALITGNSARRR